ncbi:transposase [Streptomyces globisporus]|uniref:transposase n=1 Tax=Streptomyces globisporus TaxID=1908 RepID=UPI0036DF7C31
MEDDVSGSVMTADAAHYCALRTHTQFGARRVWILLARMDPTYDDFIVMPPEMPTTLGAEVAWPDCNSIISSSLNRQLHQTSWAGLQGSPRAWSMLTTDLPETTAGGSPVPIWSGDAVVLAGRWSPQQVVQAVEMVTLPSLIGEAVPTVVVPTLGSPSDPGPENGARARVLRAAVTALSAATDRIRGSRTVDGAPSSDLPHDDNARFVGVSDAQWRMLRRVLPPEPVRPRSGPPCDLRPYFEGMLWYERTGLPWKRLPDQLRRPGATFWHRNRWKADGTLEALYELLVPYRAPAGDGITGGEITDAVWSVLKPLLPPPAKYSRTRLRDDRQVLEGIVHKYRTGQSWRNLPERFGPGPTAQTRFARWAADGTWDRLRAAAETIPGAASLAAIDPTSLIVARKPATPASFSAP